jgi:CheY-like chemotaxis protein
MPLSNDPAALRHEIRTPLTGIVGAVSLLLDSPLTDDQRNLVLAVQSAAHHLDQVISQSVGAPTVTIDPAGTIRPRPNHPQVELVRLLAEVAALFGAVGRPMGTVVSTQVDPTLPRTIPADATVLRHVLVNLMSNAVKFTGKGSVQLAARADGNTLVFEVRDSGPGFDTTPITNGRADGSGMGLALCRTFLGRIGSELQIDSTLGIGTVCRFSIPLTPRRRVLLAEDDEVSRAVLRQLVERLGHDVHDVTSGADALASMREQSFDVVLLDRRLGDDDGLDVARAIRTAEAPHGRHTPIIGVTATGTDADRAECLAAGLDDYLPKPVTLAQLAAHLDRISVQPA